ncbi:MAG TPA: hypothetical protein PLN86_12575 [Candidatus Hydrogenedentes bacterium]|nr:hypothetical protein [Candidatus Hydrogenedentota bacterium]
MDQVEIGKGKRGLLPPSAHPVVIIHPILFAIYPVLVLYAGNLGVVQPSTLSRPLFTLIIISCFLWVLFSVMFRALHKGGLVASATFVTLVPGWGVLNSILRILRPLLDIVTVPLIVAAYAVLVLLFLLVRRMRGKERPLFGRFRPILSWGILVLPMLAALFLVGGEASAGEAAVTSLYVVFAGVVIFSLVRLQGNLQKFSIAVNWFCLLLVGLYCVFIFYNRPQREAFSLPRLPVSRSDAIKGPYPDVYVLVLDGYPRGDVLRERLGYNNLLFESEMGELGFVTASQSLANYADANASLAAFLNFDYLPAPISASWNAAAYYRLCRDNRLFQLFRDAGYRIVAGSSELDCEGLSEQVDTVIKLETVPTEFETALLEQTVVGSILNGFYAWRYQNPIYWRFEPRRARILHVMDEIPRLAKSPSEQPQLVYAHFPIPSLPFLFTSVGERAVPYGDSRHGDEEVYRGTARDFVAAYAEQITFTNRRLLRIAKTLVQESTRPAVVILVSSQGLRNPEGGTSSAVETANLISMRFPDTCPSVPSGEPYDTITLVNVIRVVWNRVVGADLPLLPDRVEGVGRAAS